MKKDIYYIAAKSLLKWSPERRIEIMDKLISPYERECVRQAAVYIKNKERMKAATLNVITHALLAAKV